VFNCKVDIFFNLNYNKNSLRRIRTEGTDTFSSSLLLNEVRGKLSSSNPSDRIEALREIRTYTITSDPESCIGEREKGELALEMVGMVDDFDADVRAVAKEELQRVIKKLDGEAEREVILGLLDKMEKPGMPDAEIEPIVMQVFEEFSSVPISEELIKAQFRKSVRTLVCSLLSDKQRVLPFLGKDTIKAMAQKLKDIISSSSNKGIVERSIWLAEDTIAYLDDNSLTEELILAVTERINKEEDVEIVSEGVNFFFNRNVNSALEKLNENTVRKIALHLASNLGHFSGNEEIRKAITFLLKHRFPELLNEDSLKDIVFLTMEHLVSPDKDLRKAAEDILKESIPKISESNKTEIALVLLDKLSYSVSIENREKLEEIAPLIEFYLTLHQGKVTLAEVILTVEESIHYSVLNVLQELIPYLRYLK